MFAVLNDVFVVPFYSVPVIRRMTAVYAVSRTSEILMVIHMSMSTPGASPTF